LTERPVTGAAARRSAAAVGLVLGAVTLWQAWRGRPVAAWTFGGPAAALLIVAAASERASRAFHGAWMKLARALAWVNSRILLSATYFFVLTPMGIARRLLGADPLDRRGPRRESYWVKRKTTRPAPETFERLF
jgi:hypothetical protein